MSISRKIAALLLLAFISLNLYAEIRVIPRQPTDMFLFYSTSSGQFADDGTTRNSPFAASFLKHVNSKEPLPLLAIDIARETLTSTSQRQAPVYESHIYNNKNYTIANAGNAKRYALVIGINNYYNANIRFPNPANDAQDITNALRQLGYEVDLRIDVDLSEMEKAINDFIGKLGADRESEGLFWFGGLGFELNAHQYLMPADARITSENLIQSSSISFNYLLNDLRSTGNSINLVFIDTNRQPPFLDSTR